jgi:Kef-type K+ transport system membrane component KefB/nucleotide-binding universal stress UspA family protein
MHSVFIVLVEVLIIITVSRLMGLFFRWLKQPLVIGEIVAGIMLGPSLLGLIFPDFSATIFPSEAVPFLNVLCQVGLIFFMFLIGLELDPKYLKGQLDIAILISNVSILVPFSLASLLSLFIYPLLSSSAVSFTAFALFLGSALSITAFPVLARIITENNLQSSRLGTLALTCAAVDDVTAWCLLALAIAVTRTNSIISAIPTIIECLIYIGFMFTVGRWLMVKISKHYQRTNKLSQLLLAIIYVLVLGSSLITEAIGIHFIFGAFLVGAVMPKNHNLIRELAQKTEDFVLTFLLPIFFAYSGLKTEIGLLNSPELWGLCLAVLSVAIIGKYAGTYIAARYSGIDKKEASALGWLMNTRGLTELIVLNIGLELKVISPLLFTMLVIMALVTTFMTSPLLELTYPKNQIKLDTIQNEKVATNDINLPKSYKIIVPIANPNTQQKLLEVAAAIAGQKAIVNPLSLVELDTDSLFEPIPYEAQRLIKQRRREIANLIQNLADKKATYLFNPIIEIANDVARETINILEREQANLILLGWHRAAFSNNRLGGRVGKILSNAPVDVAVFIDKNQQQLQSLLVPYSGNIHDDFALELALRLLINYKEKILEILMISGNELSYESGKIIDKLPTEVYNRIRFETIDNNETMQAVITASENVDLTIVGTSRAWGIERQTLGRYTDQLSVECRSSLIITRRYNQITSHLSSIL